MSLPNAATGHMELTVDRVSHSCSAHQVPRTQLHSCCSECNYVCVTSAMATNGTIVGFDRQMFTETALQVTSKHSNLQCHSFHPLSAAVHYAAYAAGCQDQWVPVSTIIAQSPICQLWHQAVSPEHNQKSFQNPSMCNKSLLLLFLNIFLEVNH